MPAINGRPRSLRWAKKAQLRRQPLDRGSGLDLKVLSNRLAKIGFKLLVVAVFGRYLAANRHFKHRDRVTRIGSGAS
jgi:hypothetical protein